MFTKDIIKPEIDKANVFVLNALDMNILADMDPKEEEGGLRPVVHDCFWEKINSNLNKYASGLTLRELRISVSQNRPTETGISM